MQISGPHGASEKRAPLTTTHDVQDMVDPNFCDPAAISRAGYFGLDGSSVNDGSKVPPPPTPARAMAQVASLKPLPQPDPSDGCVQNPALPLQRVGLLTAAHLSIEWRCGCEKSPVPPQYSAICSRD